MTSTKGSFPVSVTLIHTLFYVFSGEHEHDVGLPGGQRSYCPSSLSFANLSHLLTLRLCFSVLVSLATCLQQWSELWPQHGRSMVPWRRKGKGEGYGKLAEQLNRKAERGNELQFTQSTDALGQNNWTENRGKKRKRWDTEEHYKLLRYISVSNW